MIGKWVVQPQEHDYDIIGHPQCGFHFVVTFPFHASEDGGQVGQTLLLVHVLCEQYAWKL